MTLVELMVTVIVIAILVGAVLPSANDMYRRGQVTESVNEYIGAVTLARSESSRRAGGVSLVAIDASDAANEWGRGWNIVDTRNDVVLQTYGAAPGALSLDGTDDVDEIAFDARGLPDRTVVIDMCASVGGIQVSISPVGRTSRDELTAEDCG